MRIVEIRDLRAAPGVEQLDKPSPAEELQPFDPGERVFWAFKKGIASRIGEKELENHARQFTKTYNELEARLRFTEGFAAGALEGAKGAIGDFVKDTEEVLKAIGTAMKTVLSMTYDPQLWARMPTVYITAPGTQERSKALLRCSDYVKQHHPATASAIRVMSMVEPALHLVVEALSQSGALAALAAALSQEMGALLGEHAREVLSLSGEPRKQGARVGEFAGHLAIEVALGVLGWIEVLAAMVPSAEAIALGEVAVFRDE